MGANPLPNDFGFILVLLCQHNLLRSMCLSDVETRIVELSMIELCEYKRHRCFISGESGSSGMPLRSPKVCLPRKILAFDMRCFTSIHDGVFSSFWVRVLRNCAHGERLYNDVTLMSKICLWSNFSYGKKLTYEVLCIYELGPCKEQSHNQMLDIGSYYIGFWYMRTETVGNWQNERANDTLSYMCSKQLTRFCICIRQLGLIILLRFGNCLISFC